MRRIIMNKKEIKNKCCCFTGHRPNKTSYSECEIKPLLETAIDDAIANGYKTFITGMAQGTDMLAAEIVLERKKGDETLQLFCAVPHPNFERYRSEYEKDRYKRVIENADIVQIVCEHYFRSCYQIRNKFMVDHSSLVIAFWNGGASGTKNCIDYAKCKGVDIINILDSTKINHTIR